MPKPSFDTWTVLPHGPLETLEDNLWRAEGTLPSMPLKRVMTIARLESGELVVHNPVALDDRSMAAIDAFGRVAFIVVPNGWHRLDLHPFKTRYPAARVFASSGSRKKVAEVDPNVADLAEFPDDPNVSVRVVDGTNALESVMTVRSGNNVTVVLGDAIFNMPHLGGVQGFILKHITKSSGGPHVSRVAKLFMIKDKGAFAAHLDRMATPELKRVIVAHHEAITVDPAGTLRRVAASLR